MKKLFSILALSVVALGLMLCVVPAQAGSMDGGGGLYSFFSNIVVTVNNSNQTLILPPNQNRISWQIQNVNAANTPTGALFFTSVLQTNGATAAITNTTFLNLLTNAPIKLAGQGSVTPTVANFNVQPNCYRGAIFAVTDSSVATVTWTARVWEVHAP
jgi:hypothetical protein